MIVAGGSKLDSPTPTREIYTSTLGLILASTEGPVFVTSGHAVGDAGKPVKLADGTQLGTVVHNAYRNGPKSGGTASHSHPDGPPHPTPPTSTAGGSQSSSTGASSSAEPAGPDVALARWTASVVGLPLVAIQQIGGLTTPWPVTGGQPPTSLLPIMIFGATMHHGVVETASTTVTDDQTRVQIKGVAVGRYPSTSADAGSPILTISPETHLPVLVGFHGGLVYEPTSGGAIPNTAGAVAPPKSWFVPWESAQTALGLPPFP